MNLHPFHDTPGLLGEVLLPEMVLLHQRFPRPRVDDVETAVAVALEQAVLTNELRPGARIAIAVGSRGIAEVATIVRVLVASLRRYGVEPFIIPAMGSHGGATAEGQLSVLTSLGVTEANIGAPIISSLEVDQLGALPNGLPVYIDRAANAADGIIVVNRVKPHTDFNAPIESGLSKMVVIGLGKHAGAIAVHLWGVEGLDHYLPEAAKFAVAHARILGGLAIVENAFDEVAEVAIVPPAGIGDELERRLLQRAKKLMPRLPWDNLDVLVIDKMGKNISGAGMDPNIIGRIRNTGEQKPTAARITNITVHDLTEESHGNAIGLGMADFTTARLQEKLDLQSMYINGLTAGVIALDSIKIPIALPTDREAVAAAIRTCGRSDSSQVHLARIESTLKLEYVLASTNSLEHMRAGSEVEVVGSPVSFPLETDGALTPFTRLVHNLALP
jgi:hypothetical protein